MSWAASVSTASPPILTSLTPQSLCTSISPAYIRYIEKAVGCPIKYVSVGAERDEYITMF